MHVLSGAEVPTLKIMFPSACSGNTNFVISNLFQHF